MIRVKFDFRKNIKGSIVQQRLGTYLGAIVRISKHYAIKFAIEKLVKIDGKSNESHFKLHKK